MEIGLIHSFNKCEKDSEMFKNQLENKTALLFQKEANKLELTTQKSVRMLKEKLDRQTARSLWEGKSDRSPAINRTKNEITKVNEEYERELRKIKNSSRITKSIEIFQIYYCI